MRSWRVMYYQEVIYYRNRWRTRGYLSITCCKNVIPTVLLFFFSLVFWIKFFLSFYESSEAPWVQSTKTVVAIEIYTNINRLQVGLVKPYRVFVRRFQQFRASSFFSNWPTPQFWGYFWFVEREIALNAGVYFRLRSALVLTPPP